MPASSDPFVAPAAPTRPAAPVAPPGNPWSPTQAGAAPTYAPPTYPGQSPFDPQAPWQADPGWNAEPEPTRSTVGLIGVVLGAIALATCFMGAFALIAWLFAIPAAVLGIVGLARKQDRNALPLIALGTSVVAAIVSVIVFSVAVAQTVDDFMEAADEWAGSARGAADEDGSRGLGSLDEPIEAGTSFSFDSSWFGEDATVWDVTVDGYVELPLTEFASPGRCVAIVGTITPTHVIEGDEASSWLDTPDLAVMVDGEAYDGLEACDYEPVEDAGYLHLWEAEIPVGAFYPYYYEVWIPEDVDGDIQAIVVGEPDSEGAAFVEAVEVPLTGG